MKRYTGLLVCCYLLLQVTFVEAKIKPNSIFGNHMVLQKGVDVPIWGKADEGERVTASLTDRSLPV